MLIVLYMFCNTVCIYSAYIYYSQPLPELTRVKDLKISGDAFADLCMVQEFLHNFSTALDIGKIADGKAAMVCV